MYMLVLAASLTCTQNPVLQVSKTLQHLKVFAESMMTNY